MLPAFSALSQVVFFCRYPCHILMLLSVQVAGEQEQLVDRVVVLLVPLAVLIHSLDPPTPGKPSAFFLLRLASNSALPKPFLSTTPFSEHGLSLLPTHSPLPPCPHPLMLHPIWEPLF